MACLGVSAAGVGGFVLGSFRKNNVTILKNSLTLNNTTIVTFTLVIIVEVIDDVCDIRVGHKVCVVGGDHDIIHNLCCLHTTSSSYTYGKNDSE